MTSELAQAASLLVEKLKEDKQSLERKNKKLCKSIGDLQTAISLLRQEHAQLKKNYKELQENYRQLFVAGNKNNTE